ncbi:hypothetical protein, partial [Staphylococcus aureus]
KAIFPEETAALDRLLRDVKAIIAITDKAVEFGSANRNQESAAELLKADVAMRATGADIANLLDKLAKGVAKGSDDLSDQTNSTILTSLMA